MKKLYSFLFLTLLVATVVKAEISKKEKEALLELYDSTNGNHWIKKWDLNTDVSSWYGVSVVNNKVVGLQLFHNNLMGVLPEQIGDLKHLTTLNLAFNFITGELPKTLVLLTKLKVLKLEMNRIKGEIFTNIGEMSSLEEISAFNNFLSGSIPESIGAIENLKILNLSSNSLKGVIPRSLGYLTKLETLGLFENALHGGIPVTLGNLKKLKELVLANNNLDGEIPEEFGQLASLEVIQIQNNRFSSFKNLKMLDEKQFLVFDYDREDENIQFKNINFSKSRMANKKYEDDED